MKIEKLMSENAIAVGPDTPLREVAAMLAEHRISGLPVVGERLQVLGVVSEADILLKEQGPGPRHGRIVGWLLAGGRADTAKLSARTAGEAMTSPAITIGRGAQVSSAARLMTENGIKRLPVVDADGTLDRDRHARGPRACLRATGCGDRARDPRRRDVPQRSGSSSRASPCGSSKAR